MRLFALWSLFLGICCQIVPLTAHASDEKDDSQRVWIRLTVKGADIWPVRANGSCWDQCWETPKVPPRELKPYAWYLKFPGFKKAMKGWMVPDVKAVVRFGKQVIELSVQNNQLQPKWNVTRVIRVGPRDSFSVEVLDVDSFGSERIGLYTSKTLPSTLWKGGALTLRKFGQVENFTLSSSLISARKPVPGLDLTPPKQPKRPTPSGKQPPKKVIVPPVRVVPSKQPIPKVPVRKEPSKRSTPPASPRKVTKKVVKKPPVKKVIKRDLGEKVVYRVRIHRADIWPVKKNGVCWDYCWWKTAGMPTRGMPHFQEYLKSKVFRSTIAGNGAPDVWASVQFGSKTYQVKLINNSIQPVWNRTFLVETYTKEPLTIKVFDKDTFDSELIGEKTWKVIPASWSKSKKQVILGPFGQVERLVVSFEKLRRVTRKTPVFPKTVIPPGVQFVKVTVVKAKLWPVTKSGGCWDTCATMSIPPLPPRGLQEEGYYKQSKSFQKMAKGSQAPDVRVKIKLGRYDVYVTPTINDNIAPAWNASHVFRIRGNESLFVEVSDDDENIAHDFLSTYRSTKALVGQFSQNVMGTYSSPYLPPQMFRGGRLILRSFGQVEYLELKVELLQKAKTKPGCDGVYRVRVAEVALMNKRADGKDWHAGVGSMTKPSPYAILKIGGHRLETAVAYKSLRAVYQDSKLIPIRANMPMTLEIRDYTMGLNLSLDRKISIPFLPIRIGLGMKKESGSKVVGQTAFLSTCDVIKKAKQGVVRLKSFGRLKSVVLFFDKVSTTP